MPNTTEKRSKRRGAVLSALVMGGLFLCLAVCMLLDFFAGETGLGEQVLVVVCVVLVLVPVGGIAAALHQRMKEIEGGEEDEAKKY